MKTPCVNCAFHLDLQTRPLRLRLPPRHRRSRISTTGGPNVAWPTFCPCARAVVDSDEDFRTQDTRMNPISQALNLAIANQHRRDAPNHCSHSSRRSIRSSFLRNPQTCKCKTSAVVLCCVVVCCGVVWCGVLCGKICTNSTREREAMNAYMPCWAHDGEEEEEGGGHTPFELSFFFSQVGPLRLC
jgi:hypothetical protein